MGFQVAADKALVKRSSLSRLLAEYLLHALVPPKRRVGRLSLIVQRNRRGDPWSMEEQTS